MTEDKKYYWIKLKTDFFNQNAIDFLMSQDNGCEYIVLYQMLCLQTANTKGVMATQIGEIIIPYDAKKISINTKYFDIDTVTVALELYKRLGLIYQEQDGTLCISDYDEMIGSETKWAEKKRNYRKNKALIEGQTEGQIEDNERTLSDKSIEIRDKSIEKDIEKDIKEKEIPKGISKKKPTKEKYGEYNNVLLTDDEYNRLCNDYSQESVQKAIKFLDEYIEEKGYKSQSHNLSMRRWVFEAIGCVRGGSQTLAQKNNDILNNAISTGELK